MFIIEVNEVKFQFYLVYQSVFLMTEFLWSC